MNLTTFIRPVRRTRAAFVRSNSTVAAEVQDDRIVVFGGGGYVGGAICRAALAKGLKVTSINRSGNSSAESWTNEVEWIEGSVRLLL
jgi:hypothetical protein